MALTDFKAVYDNAYEEVLNTVLVAKSIANMRFEPSLVSGGSVVRTVYDISAARVRTVVRNAPSTIDTITDSTESLIINLEKEIVFPMSDGELKQASNFSPMETIGAQAANKIATDLDARVFAEVLNAYQTFDNGDLTTTVSDGTPITLSATTVPQMVSQMPAKLKSINNILSNMAFVVDAYAISQIEQYLLGKQFDIVNSTFKNGYSGAISMAEVYVSQNLTGSALFTDVGLADGETIVINGITFTAKTTLGTDAGNFALGSNNTEAIANLVNLINNPSVTDATGVALSTANQALITDAYKITASVVTAASSFKIVGTGSGRLAVSDTAASGAWTLNTIHAYYGKKGAIDLVVQDKSEVDIRECADRRGVNIFSSYLAGIKTFADGAKKFLNVKIAA